MIQTAASRIGIDIQKIRATIVEVTGRDANIAEPTAFERTLWQAIKDSIKPHLYGTMPKIVMQTYSHEQQSQSEYRKKVYRSKSHALVMQSIQDVHKIAQSDDFVIQFNETVAAILERTFFSGVAVGADMVKKAFSTIYKDRVLDPNGYIGIVPHAYQNDDPTKKWYELEMYPSENVIARSRDVVIIAISQNLFRVYTRTAIFLMRANGDIEGAPFVHNSENLGCYLLGGVPMDIEVNAATARQYGDIYNDNSFAAIGIASNEVTQVVEVQMSDYSYAVDELDRLENRNSQNEVVTTLHVHPRMVARDLGCDECDGIGKVQAKDAATGEPLNAVIDGAEDGMYAPVMHTCHKCNGRGVLNIGTQDVITVPMPAGDFTQGGQNASLADLGNSILAYISPDVTSAEFLYKQLNECVQNAKEMLRLQRFEDFSESGAAKRIDQEAAQPRLRAIAEGLQTLIRNILQGLVGFEFVATLQSGNRDAALASIAVGLPAFFDLTTVAESKAQYFENIDKKPLFERYLEQKNIIKKQYQSATQSAIFEFAYNYTNGANLLLQSELVDMNALGVLSTEEVYIAKFIDSFIRRALAKRATALQSIDITQEGATELLTPLVDAERDAALAIMRAQAAARASMAQALNTPPQM